MSTDPKPAECTWDWFEIPTLPPIVLGETKEHWCYREAHLLGRQQSTPISAVVVDGREYITTMAFETYIRFPMMNLYSCAWEECWFQQTPETRNVTRNWDHDNKSPDPRLVRLFLSGTCLPHAPQRHAAVVEGYTSPHHVVVVQKDPNDNWWFGGGRHSMAAAFVRPAKGIAEPQRMLIYPSLSFLGHDSDDEVWQNSDFHGERTRLTMCVMAVKNAITEANLFGTYFPKGAARFEVEVAKAEMAEFLRTDKRFTTLEMRCSRLEMQLAAEQVQLKSVQSQKNTLHAQCVSVSAELKACQEENEAIKKLILEKDECIAKMQAQKGFNPLW